MNEIKTGTLTVAGIGSGKFSQITAEVLQALKICDCIAGYEVYINLVKEHFPGKEFLSTPMRKEEERCRLALQKASEGKNVVFICSGDAGVYGMASPMLEVALSEGFTDVKVIPGVSAAMSGAAIVGAPVGHDFCVISLSDLLTPWDVIEKRLSAAADGDFCIVLYNPSSHKRKDYLMKACEILLKSKSESTVCAIARNIGREGESAEVLTLRELKSTQTDMFTTVFIGNSKSRKIGSYMVTPRGYLNE